MKHLFIIGIIIINTLYAADENTRMHATADIAPGIALHNSSPRAVCCQQCEQNTRSIEHILSKLEELRKSCLQLQGKLSYSTTMQSLSRTAAQPSPPAIPRSSPDLSAVSQQVTRLQISRNSAFKSISPSPERKDNK